MLGLLEKRTSYRFTCLPRHGRYIFGFQVTINVSSSSFRSFFFA